PKASSASVCAWLSSSSCSALCASGARSWLRRGSSIGNSFAPDYARRRTSVPELPRGDRNFARVVVEAAPALAAEPAGLDVLHQQRRRPVLAVAGGVVEYADDVEAGVEPDEVGELERTHRMVEADPAAL